MKITIANLKHSASLSEETHAYTATILVDGVRAFTGSNHGTGGPDMYHPIPGYKGPDERAIDAWLKDNTPKIEGHGMTIDNCLEIVVGDLINDVLRAKALKRLLSTKIIVMQQEKGEDALFTYKGKPTPENLAMMRRHIADGKIKGQLVNGADDFVMDKALLLV